MLLRIEGVLQELQFRPEYISVVPRYWAFSLTGLVALRQPSNCNAMAVESADNRGCRTANDSYQALIEAP